MKHFILIVITVLVFTACSYQKTADVKRLEVLVADNRAEDSLKFVQIQRDILSQRQTIQELSGSIENIKLQCESYMKSPLPLQRIAELDSLKATINKLQKQLSEQSELLKFSSDRITTMLEDAKDNSLRVVALEKKLAELSPNPPSSIIKSEKNTPSLSPPPSPKPTYLSSAAQELYDKARNAYEKRELDKAASLFKEFLKSYPQHELAPNSQYWLGETYYAAEEYIKAIRELQKVLDDFANSPKAPDAQFKIGICYLRMHDKTNAKAELEELRKRFPSYERMALVDKYLQSIK